MSLWGYPKISPGLDLPTHSPSWFVVDGCVDPLLLVLCRSRSSTLAVSWWRGSQWVLGGSGAGAKNPPRDDQTKWKTTTTLNPNNIRPYEKLPTHWIPTKWDQMKGFQWRMLEYRMVRKNDIKFWICLNCSEEIFEKRLQILQKLPTHNLMLMVSKVMICCCRSLSNPIEGHIRQSMLYFQLSWVFPYWCAMPLLWVM